MAKPKLGSFADKFAETKAAAEAREREREEAVSLLTRGESAPAALGPEAPTDVAVEVPAEASASVGSGAPNLTTAGPAVASDVKPLPIDAGQSLRIVPSSTPSQGEPSPRMRVQQKRGPYSRPGVAIYESTERQINEMVYFFKTYGPKLRGKLGNALFIRAAIDELYHVFKSDPSRFFKRVEEAARNGAADKAS